MSVKVTNLTVDIQTGSQHDELIEKILDDLTSRSKPFASKNKADVNVSQFAVYLDEFLDFIRDRSMLLKKNSLASHHYLWICTIGYSANKLIDLKKHFTESYLNGQLGEGDTSIGILATTLGRIRNILDDMYFQFYRFRDINYRKLVLSSSHVRGIFFDTLIDCLEIISIDKIDKMHYLERNSANVKHIVSFTKNLLHDYGTYKEDVMGQCLYYSFPFLSSLMKVVYMSGESSLLVDFFEYGSFIRDKIMNYFYPITLIQSMSLNYIDLIDFYRYTAFNLIVLSTSTEEIKDEYNHQADIYFKSLLKNPGLSFELYFQEKGDDDETSPLKSKSDSDCDNLISLRERQEISLLYILNYILKTTDIKELVHAEEYFNKEVNFFCNSLSETLSDDINHNNSSSGSSYSPEEEHSTRLSGVNKIHFRSPSTLVLQGSYKEKLLFVLLFVKQFSDERIRFSSIMKNFSFYETSDSQFKLFERFFAITDVEKKPGALLYIKILDKISRLLTLLSIKHLVVSIGMNGLSESFIRNKFPTPHSIQECVSVKNLLVFSTSDHPDPVYHFKRVAPSGTSSKSIIEKQLLLMDLIKYVENANRNLH